MNLSNSPVRFIRIYLYVYLPVVGIPLLSGPLRSSRPSLALDDLPFSTIDRTRSIHPLPLSLRACVRVGA